MTDYSTRRFVEGDAQALAELARRVDRQYLRPSAKSPREWKRRLLGRPGVEPEGIAVVERRDGEVAGYAVVGRSGKVYELCVPPELPATVLDSLLVEVERYAKQHRAEQMTIAAPPGRRRLVGRLRRAGYTPWLKHAVVLPLDFPRLIEGIAQHNAAASGRRVRGCLAIRLERGRGRFRSPAFTDELYLRVEHGKPQAGQGRIEPDVTIRTDVTTFSNLILGQAGLARALLRRQIRVAPWHRLPRAVALLSLAVLPCAWYLPLGDSF